MFTIHKTDTGAVPPWEYMAAAAGTYKAGQMLNVTAGKLVEIAGNSAVTPPYLCMADITAEDGNVIPVTRVTDDAIYMTEFGAGVSTGTVTGYPMAVAAGGLAVVGDSAGCFWISAMEDDVAAEGGIVYGRFR